MMDVPDRELAVFSEALRMPAGARAAFLNEACADDPALRQRVQELIFASEALGEFLKSPAPAPSEPLGADRFPLVALEKPGDVIGRYKLLQQIGEGGCGVVYVAEQLEPVRRRVALKVIKLGMETRNVIARFEAERQALALMDHPNIAKVLDAGATETGRPFFVMELVQGVKITEFCDQRKLSTRERLDLFIQVCHAIQHAHQKGIIHRDIKPSNILVALNGSEPVPKVIDFGIAKATTDEPLTDKTLFTAFAQFIGTPAYMSPEQAEMSEQGIDTRSDVYSLGVLLYELLTGLTPFNSGELRRAGLDEIRRTIREEEPTPPSVRLHTMTEANLTALAACHQIEPARLSGLMRGELDWIVMKALEKERERRYETAFGLACDVERYLADQPIVARPSSQFYRFQKFVRRHKLAFAAISTVSISLMAGLLVSTLLLIRETHLRQRAVTAEQIQTQLREQAEKLRSTADDQAGQIRHQLYASHMSEAFQAWDRGDLTRVDGLLDEHRPKPGEPDERGFEWFYLWRLCHSAQFTLLGHNDLLRGVAYSPDGALLATAGNDSTARLWDAHTGKQLCLLAGHSGGVIALAFSPDGKTLATGSGDKTISLWDVATGRELAVLRGHNFEVTALAFGPDGTWLASADGMVAQNEERDPLAKYVDTTTLATEVKLWDVKSRKVMRTLKGHTASILSLAVSPDGQRLVSGSVDSTVRVWDVASGILETNLTGFNGQVMAVAISPDGQSLAVGLYPYYKKGELQVFNLKDYSERLHFKGQIGPVFTLAFSPDGRTLASGGLDQIVRFWDSATGDELRSIKGHRGSIWSLAWSPAGDRIASASWDQTVKVWDAVQPQGLDLSTGTEFYTSCFSPDGKLLVRGNQHLLVYESGTSNPPFTIPDYQADNLVVAISPDGSILASGGSDQKVTLWELGTWRRLTTIEGYQSQIWNLTFSPDGGMLASSDAKSVHLWDVKKGQELNVLHFQTDDRVGNIFFSADGRTLITSVSGTVTFFDARTGRELNHDAAGLYYLAQSHDGNSIAALVGSDLVLIDPRTMQAKWHASAQGKLVWSASFSPDDKTLATASWDGTAKLWSVAGGQEMFAHPVPGVAWNAVFSPDGKWLSVGGGSPRIGEMALFRSATRAEVESAEPPPAIEVQPASQTATAGGAATLNVSATGENPFTYEWRKDGNFLAGQMNAALKLDNLSVSDAGEYTVSVTDRHGRSVTSSNACLIVLPVRQESFGEIDFIAKQPESSSCWTGSEHPVAWKRICAVQAGAGLHGAPALVLTADGSGFLTNLSQAWTEMGMGVSFNVTNPAVFNTTNLNLYKLEATVRTTGLLEDNSHGRVTLQFLSDTSPVLAVSMPETFSTNYQVCSFVLGNAEIDAYSGGSWDQFVANLTHIDGVRCLVSADDWLREYDVQKKSAFYLAHVKFYRLIPPTAEAGRSAP